jgi:macrolide transport system ATP-binding/permease protein
MLQDIKYALRAALRNPAFMVVVVGSLALGIGANTMIFTVVNAVFLRPVPVSHPETLVQAFTTDTRNGTGLGGGFGGEMPTSWPNFKDYRDQIKAFDGLAASRFVNMSLGVGEPEQLAGQLVTGNYFDVLGVKAQVGRTFLPEEDKVDGAVPVVLLSNGLWKRRFGGDRTIVNHQILLNNTQFTVVGVMPEDFRGLTTLGATDCYVPIAMHGPMLTGMAKDFFESRRFLGYSIVGRLKPGVAKTQAEAEMQTLARSLEKAFPGDNEKRSIKLQMLNDSLLPAAARGGLAASGGMLLAATGLVLLIACGNIASLLLARAQSRRKEIAIRLSLGAPRWRLIRQLLTESTLLAVLGGLLGILVANWGRDLLWSFRPPFLAAGSLDLRLDPRVLLFTMALSVITGVLFGLAPAVQASRADLVSAIKNQAEPLSRLNGRVTKWLNLRSALVVTQVALSLIALIGAGLFVRSLRSAQQIDPGFSTRDLAVMGVDLDAQGYTKDRGWAFFRQSLERVRALPGVQSATWAETIPLGFGARIARTVAAEGQENQPGQRGIAVAIGGVWTGYLQTMGISLLQGRDFTDADRDGSHLAVIVNETMARRFWKGDSAIGKRFKFYRDDRFWQVIGVARDGKYNNIGEDPQPYIYYPVQQTYVGAMNVAVRTSGDSRAVLAAMQREVRAMDPALPILNPQTMTDMIDANLWAPRMEAMLLGLFGLLALVLATVGIYGVMSYSVTRRTREIGIRVALGAKTSDVLSMILQEGMMLTLAGVALGVVGSLAVTHYVASLLYGVSATDAPTFAGITLLLALVSLAANYLPARRATLVDPLVTLKYD